MLQPIYFLTLQVNEHASRRDDYRGTTAIKLETRMQWLRKYVSPAFLALLMASFILWYIAKLNYTYTTEQVANINVNGEKFSVTCVVEGIGTNLFGYRIYKGTSLRIPLSELQYTSSQQEGHEGMIVIDPHSLQNAISVRYSDIKVVSIGAVPEIKHPFEND